MNRQGAAQNASATNGSVEADGPLRCPFQQRVDQVAAKRFDAELEANSPGVRDMEGIKPRLQLSMIYHNVRRAGLWKEGCSARVAFSSRLVAGGISKRLANSLAWRLVEDALCGCEGKRGFNAAALGAELDAMKA
jgi:hypothetical protein